MSGDERRVVLITGASSGIGQACARLLAAREMRVFGTSRRADGLAGEAFEGVVMDVCDDGSVTRAVERVLEVAGRIDVLINNAGYALAGAVEDTSITEAQRQLDTNLIGVLRVTKAVLPGMRARGKGLIVNVGSLGGVVGMPFQGVYSASKFALEGLTEALRHELRGFGVWVTIVEPGDVRTQITDNRVIAEGAAGSEYAGAFEKVMRICEKEEREGPEAMVVAELIGRIVRARGEPRVRYAVGRVGQTVVVWAKRVLPAGVFEWALGVYFGVR
ncbi:MAG: SDR family oxidoreductase [Deltaproteobacteria bacterium]|nr:SDR family oxidoreductase [Deltaproteobacteria bacterium]